MTGRRALFYGASPRIPDLSHLIPFTAIPGVKLQLAKAIGGVNLQSFPDDFVAWLSDAVPCDNVAVIAYFQDRRPWVLKAFNDHPSVHAKLETEYVDAAYLLDPFHELHINRAQKGVYRLMDVAPDHFYRNQYFVSYYRDTTLVDEIAFVSYPSEGVSIQTCLGRDSNSNTRFSTRQISQARRIAPIVSVLVEKHWSELNTSGEYSESETISRLIESVHEKHSVRLTPRQAEVAFYILKGHSSISIGLTLGVARTTVKVFRKQLYKRLNISSQAELFNLLLPLLGRDK